MKNKREILIIDNVLNLLNTPDKWTQHTSAKGKDGNIVAYMSDAATCWCLDGAIHNILYNMRLSKTKEINSIKKITYALNNQLCQTDVSNQGEYIRYNDRETTTYNDIIKTLKKAKEILTNGISKAKA